MIVRRQDRSYCFGVEDIPSKFFENVNAHDIVRGYAVQATSDGPNKPVLSESSAKVTVTPFATYCGGTVASFSLPSAFGLGRQPASTPASATTDSRASEQKSDSLLPTEARHLKRKHIVEENENEKCTAKKEVTPDKRAPEHNWCGDDHLLTEVGSKRALQEQPEDSSAGRSEEESPTKKKKADTSHQLLTATTNDGIYIDGINLLRAEQPEVELIPPLIFIL